jgi:hypothetical protein
MISLKTALERLLTEYSLIWKGYAVSVCFAL